MTLFDIVEEYSNCARLMVLQDKCWVKVMCQCDKRHDSVSKKDITVPFLDPYSTPIKIYYLFKNTKFDENANIFIPFLLPL